MHSLTFYSFDIKEDKLVLFDRTFEIDEITGVTRLGLKFSISFFAKKFFQYGYPEGKIRIIEGVDVLNPNSMVHFQIDYSSGDEKGTINFKQSVEKLKEDFYFQSNPSAVCALFDFTKKDRTDFLSIVGDVEKSNVEKTLTFAVTFNLFPKKKELPAGEGLAKKLGTLLMNGEWSDIKLICEGQVFKCHKIVLCCNSDVFKNMLLNKSMEEANSGEIEITDTPAAALESLVHFLYNNSLDRSLITCDLLSAAEKYLVPDLVRTIFMQAGDIFFLFHAVFDFFLGKDMYRVLVRKPYRGQCGRYHGSELWN